MIMIICTSLLVVETSLILVYLVYRMLVVVTWYLASIRNYNSTIVFMRITMMNKLLDSPQASFLLLIF